MDYIQLALESYKAPDTFHNVPVIERKYSMGHKYLFELRRYSSYGGSSNRVTSENLSGHFHRVRRIVQVKESLE